MKANPLPWYFTSPKWRRLRPRWKLLNPPSTGLESIWNRTEVRAPFEGRIRRKLVDLGQTVASGTPLADIFSTAFAEVKLPLADSQLAFLQVPLGQGEFLGPEVVLGADFSGSHQQWYGTIVRTAGEVDPANRMVHLIARVEDPYGEGRFRQRATPALRPLRGGGDRGSGSPERGYFAEAGPARRWHRVGGGRRAAPSAS